MQWVFIASMTIGALYFGFSKRCFDLFSAAYAGCLLYFMPGFFGYGMYHVQGHWMEIPLHSRTYGVMTAVAMLLLCTAVVFDLADKGRSRQHSTNRKSNPELFLLATAALAGLLLMLLTSRDALFSGNKQDMLAGLNRWHIVFISSSQVGFCLAALARQYRWLFLFTLLLLFDLYIGFRTAMAMSLGAVVIASLHAQGPKRLLLQHKRAVLLASAAVFFIMVVQGYIGHIKQGNWEFIASQRMNLDSVLTPIRQNESFIVAATLNEVISSDFRWNIGDYLTRSGMALVPLGNLLTDDISRFEFQYWLFPSVDYGMASTPWGESWATGGPLLLVIVICLFCAVIAFANRFVFRTTAPVKAACMVAMAYWCLYIHRNSMEYQLVIEKRLIVIAILLVFIRLASRRLQPPVPGRRILGTRRDQEHQA